MAGVGDIVDLGSVRATVFSRVLWLDPVVSADATLWLSNDYAPDTKVRIAQLTLEGWVVKEETDGREEPEASEVGEAGTDRDQGLDDQA